MAGIPLIGALSTIGSSVINGISGYLANQELAGAIKTAANTTRQNFTDSLAALQPSITAGNTARDAQLGLLGLPGGNSDAIDLFRRSPGYTAGLNAGRDAITGSAAAGGRLFSGGTVKALDRFGQNYADQQFGNYYDRLSGLSGAGNTATGTAVNLGTNTANNLSDLAINEGQAKGSSYVNWGNQIGSGIQNLADLYAYYTKNKTGVPTFAPNAASQGFVY